jgi:hypothetical protein
LRGAFIDPINKCVQQCNASGPVMLTFASLCAAVNL